MNETSDPGRKDGGSPAEIGLPVAVTRTYDIGGPGEAACAAVLQAFRGAGWTFERQCSDPIAQTSAAIVLRGRLACEDFNILAEIIVYTEAPPDLRTMRVRLTAPYPDDEPSSSNLEGRPGPRSEACA